MLNSFRLTDSEIIHTCLFSSSSFALKILGADLSSLLSKDINQSETLQTVDTLLDPGMRGLTYETSSDRLRPILLKRQPVCGNLIQVYKLIS